MANPGAELRAWLADVPWTTVVLLNEQMCRARQALHKNTSACARVEAEWNQRRDGERTLRQVMDFLRWCHRAAPFCFFNGNTFAAIARTLLVKLDIPAPQAAGLRSAVGHYVAGVLNEVEFAEMLETIEQPP